MLREFEKKKSECEGGIVNTCDWKGEPGGRFRMTSVREGQEERDEYISCVVVKSYRSVS